MSTQPPAKRQRRTASEVHTAEVLALKKDAVCDSKAQVVAWLKNEASKQPGHSTLSESRGMTKQNAEVVQEWRFVHTFAGQHVGTYVEIQVCILTC